MKPVDGTNKDRERRAIKRRLEALDWDFATQQSESPFSTLHWHPCRFPSQVPATVISRLTDISGVVLDPFMGSATTLVEAQRLGRRSIGVDINPISTTIARSKLITDDSTKVVYFIDRLIDRVYGGWDSLPAAEIPKSVQCEKWYAESTTEELRRLWGVVVAEDSPYSDIVRAAFSSVLISVCKETRHWGYICDNSTPKTDRVGDARGAFSRSLKAYRSAYLSRHGYGNGDIPLAEVIEGDAREVVSRIQDGAIDLVVTSPPYFGVADYAKSQRLSMEWFGRDIEPVRQSEIGARSKRHRKAASLDFLKELRGVFVECHRVLKSGGYAVVVLGSSPVRSDIAPDFLNEMGGIGFSVEAELSRNISSMRRQFPSLSSERVFILRRE